MIPKNYFLVKLAQVVNFSFVNDLVKDLYHESNGRPAWEPQVLFKMLFLEFLHKLSDVEISKMAQTELAFKWFIGLKVTDAVPDDSTLVRFRQRLGENKNTNLNIFRILPTATTKYLTAPENGCQPAAAFKKYKDSFLETARYLPSG